jgi:hypothetical protein
MSITTNRDDPGLQNIVTEGPRKGQQEAYLVLSEEERAKGFVMPVQQSYRHIKCGTDTRMGLAIAETYARDPKFYGGTFCVYCGTHYPLRSAEGPQFFWVEPDGSRGCPVGSSPEEAAAWKWQEDLRQRAAKLVEELSKEECARGPGLRCSKCGGSLVHERLNGYRCIRGCSL